MCQVFSYILFILIMSLRMIALAHYTPYTLYTDVTVHCLCALWASWERWDVPFTHLLVGDRSIYLVVSRVKEPENRLSPQSSGVAYGEGMASTE